MNIFPFCFSYSSIYFILLELISLLVCCVHICVIKLRLHSRYGISGTPTIILWLDGIGVARMDDSPFSLEAFKEFIEKWTDLEPISSLTVQEADYEGPLPSRTLFSLTSFATTTVLSENFRSHLCMVFYREKEVDSAYA